MLPKQPMSGQCVEAMGLVGLCKLQKGACVFVCVFVSCCLFVGPVQAAEMDKCNSVNDYCVCVRAVQAAERLTGFACVCSSWRVRRYKYMQVSFFCVAIWWLQLESCIKVCTTLKLDSGILSHDHVPSLSLNNFDPLSNNFDPLIQQLYLSH